MFRSVATSRCSRQKARASPMSTRSGDVVAVDQLLAGGPAAAAEDPHRRGYAYLLGKLFWTDIEAHHPAISSLKHRPAG